MSDPDNIKKQGDVGNATGNIDQNVSQEQKTMAQEVQPDQAIPMDAGDFKDF